MYSTIRTDWAYDQFGLSLKKWSTVDEDLREKTIYTFLFSVTLTFAF